MENTICVRSLYQDAVTDFCGRSRDSYAGMSIAVIEEQNSPEWDVTLTYRDQSTAFKVVGPHPMQQLEEELVRRVSTSQTVPRWAEQSS